MKIENLSSFALKLKARDLLLHRDGLKGGPVLLSNSQAGPGTNFPQPRTRLLANESLYTRGLNL